MRNMPEILCDRVYDDAGKVLPVCGLTFLFFKISFSSDWKRLKTSIKIQVIPALVFS